MFDRVCWGYRRNMTMTMGDQEAATQVAENITTLMFRAGTTQRGISRATGIAEATISNKMTGRTSWTLNDLQLVARALHVTIAELVGTIPDRATWEMRHTDG